MKPKVGIFGVTSCMGCMLTVLFDEHLLKIVELIDLRAWHLAKEKNDPGPFDIVICEGTIVNKEDLEYVKKLREKAGFLISLGACAVHGNMPAMKNLMSRYEVEHSVYDRKIDSHPINPAPLSKHVDVDYEIPGCPPAKDEIRSVLKDLLLGRKPHRIERPVCFECRLRENRCLLNDGIPCMGPLTQAGCHALCPSVNHPCTGCRGPIGDSNYASEFSKLLELGYDKDFIMKKMSKYAAPDVKEKLTKVRMGESERVRRTVRKLR